MIEDLKFFYKILQFSELKKSTARMCYLFAVFGIIFSVVGVFFESLMLFYGLFMFYSMLMFFLSAYMLVCVSGIAKASPKASNMLDKVMYTFIFVNSMVFIILNVLTGIIMKSVGRDRESELAVVVLGFSLVISLGLPYTVICYRKYAISNVVYLSFVCPVYVLLNTIAIGDNNIFANFPLSLNASIGISVIFYGVMCFVGKKLSTWLLKLPIEKKSLGVMAQKYI